MVLNRGPLATTTEPAPGPWPLVSYCLAQPGFLSGSDRLELYVVVSRRVLGEDLLDGLILVAGPGNHGDRDVGGKAIEDFEGLGGQREEVVLREVQLPGDLLDKDVDDDDNGQRGDDEERRVASESELPGYEFFHGRISLISSAVSRSSGP